MTGCRLNLGCGGQIVEGWVNVDKLMQGIPGPGYEVAAPGSNAWQRQLDIVKDRWPWERGSAEGIVLHHVLDLMSVAEMRVVLDRCYETLDHGGVLRVSCADLGLGIEKAIAQDWEWFPERRWIHYHDETDIEDTGETLLQFVTQGGARKQWLTPDRFMDACMRSGFQYFIRDEDQCPWIRELDSREGESWFCEAVR